MGQCFHAWEKTTSDTVEKCSKCHLVRSVSTGTVLSPVVPARKKKGNVPIVQPDLWASSQQAENIFSQDFLNPFTGDF
jgi:hypothetical protein